MPRGFALRVDLAVTRTWSRSAAIKIRCWKKSLFCSVVVLLRRFFVGQMSTGASNDFSRATKLARSMVTRFGMSDSMGVMVYEDSQQKVISEALLKLFPKLPSKK